MQQFQKIWSAFSGSYFLPAENSDENVSCGKACQRGAFRKTSFHSLIILLLCHFQVGVNQGVVKCSSTAWCRSNTRTQLLRLPAHAVHAPYHGNLCDVLQLIVLHHFCSVTMIIFWTSYLSSKHEDFCHGVADSFLCILVVCVPFRSSNTFYYWWLFCNNNYCLSACHLPSLILLVATWNHCSTGRNSSVGRASDWRSEGPWFNPGFRQLFFLFCMAKIAETIVPAPTYW